MVYYARKFHYVNQSIIPVGWFLIVIWLMYKGEKDVESILVASFVILVLSAIFIYSLVKQSKTPLVVTDEEGICVHDIMRGKESTLWDLVIRLKKYPVIGYKLETLGRDIWLPIGMLTSTDAQSLLNEVKDRVNQKT